MYISGSLRQRCSLVIVLPTDPVRKMMQLLSVRTGIYDQFQGSSAGKAFFFRPENADAYAAYYTSMYLIQDTGEAIFVHMAKDFSADPMQAYLEFWGVMQAINIQQDAILQMHKAVVGSARKIRLGKAWRELRNVRHACAGHPASRTHGVPGGGPQRTFMGRSFGNYNVIRYELWDAITEKSRYPVINLRQMINDYDAEASAVLNDVLSTMKSKWPSSAAG
jgi:hypothetical protein